MAENVGGQEPSEGSRKSDARAGTTPSAAPVPTSQTVRQWVESLQVGGGLNPGVELYDDPVNGRHLRVKPMLGASIEKGTNVAICSIAATMSYMNLLPDIEGLPQHSFVYDQKFLEKVDHETACAFFLMDQYLAGEKSFWAPYIRSLPGPGSFTTTQYYDGEDLDWLQGTNLELARHNHLKKWRSNYEQGLVLLRAASNPAVSSYSWERFLWAMTIFSSRGFSPRILSGIDSRFASHGKLYGVLVPLLDFANHRPRSKVEWFAGKDTVSLKILEDVEPGMEIYNNYGPKNNESLMVSYGFCMGDNPFDYRTVSLRATPGNFLYDLRLEQKRRFPKQDENTLGTDYFIFSVFYRWDCLSRKTEEFVFSRDLLDAISISAANGREVQQVKMEPNRLYIPSSTYGGSRSILTGLSQIQFELVGQILKATAGGFLERTPLDEKQQKAKLYREIQLMHLENALALSSWTLHRATTIVPRPSNEVFLEEILAKLPEEKFGLPVRDRVRGRIQDRNSIVEYDGELFKGDAVTTILPTETADCVHEFLRRVLKAAKPALEESQLPISSEMVTYCIFIRFCVAAYKHLPQDKRSEVLGSRIKRWAPFILNHYPEPASGHELMVEDSDVDYLLTSIHEALQGLRGNHVEVFEPVETFTGPWLDGGWLSRHSFRWAWYTAEDEMVQVPRNPLRLVRQPGVELSLRDLDMDDMSGDWYLYIPHEDVESERE